MKILKIAETDMIKKLLEEKNYPPILKMNSGEDVSRESWEKRRAELVAALTRYSYGNTPRSPEGGTSGRVTYSNPLAYAGKVTEERVELTFSTERGEFTFPIQLYIPNSVRPSPIFLHIAFRPVPDRYIPVEEITDAGYALAVVVYTDLVNDNHHGDFSDGLAAYFGTGKDREPDEWGKIGMWAYGASRVMDYILTREELDGGRVAVIGHSRLGKTALWCAAQDRRIACAISNNSGYGGAASSKHGKGERISDFLRVGSWDWYCEAFGDFETLEDEKPYDQSYLTALIAPRLLIVGSAEEDKGADPEAELLTTLHASCAWELLGKRGLVVGENLPTPPETLFDGEIGYHIRCGMHFLSREDWAAYIKFLDKKWGRV